MQFYTPEEFLDGLRADATTTLSRRERPVRLMEDQFVHRFTGTRRNSTRKPSSPAMAKVRAW